MKTVSGNIVDVLNSEIYPGKLKIANGKITDITRETKKQETYIIPGFVDAHVHIESSMLPPSEFARVAAVHGTVAVVSDPHEIANVLGMEGVNYMIENAKTVPLKFFFGAPSCVPASPFETNGAVIGPEHVEELLKMAEIKYLSEIMNFPAVISGAPDIYAKISIAKKYRKLIDGHAPGLTGKDLGKYASAGISTDHECFTRKEAREKIKIGMKIIIREGSAAENLDELIPLLKNHDESCMFCSDDKHPDELIRGHINNLVKRSLECGIDLMKVLKVACINPVLHYGLDVGMLRHGDYADFLVVDDLNNLNILKTVINGETVAEEGRSLITKTPTEIVNNFNVSKRKLGDFTLPYKSGNIAVIEAISGQLITKKLVVPPKIVGGNVVSDPERDILKIVVVNRYREAKVAIGFVKNFGLKKGAIAASVAHDSHNIIATGVTDEDICRAVNLIIENKGGLSAVSKNREIFLPLPIAGLMSNEDYPTVAEKYALMDSTARAFGSRLDAPFMSLSFMALLVIPSIKLSDRGLFDGEKFAFMNIFQEGME
ncbi:MAG: adenine deaminase [Syntrophales bacterium]